MNRVFLFLIILLLPLSFNVFGQKTGKKYYITGQITDFNGKPVTDAIILIDYLNTEVVSDANGMYKVRVKNDAVSITVFKLLNGQIEEKINARTVINFKLPAGTGQQATQEQVKPNEQVNIGYGTSSKKDLTTPVSKIDGSKKEFVSYSSIYEMLQQDPSIQVNGKKIVIRGVGTINNTDPLFVVNGIIVGSIDDISPQTVKSIEILKGGDAAMYGSRGMNGVILITLKEF